MSDRPIGMATPTVEELEAEIERLRAVLQRIADMPVDGYESTIPVRSIARVALEDDNENDDTDGRGQAPLNFCDGFRVIPTKKFRGRN